jgi:hypothetical protein
MNSPIQSLKHFRYEDTKCALGLQVSPLFPAAELRSLSTCARVRTPGERSREGSLERAIAAADVNVSRTEAVGNDDLWEKDGAADNTALATTEQASLFGDNMETNAWEWSMYLELSPVNDQSPPDIES